MERKFVTLCLSILGAATLCSCGNNAEPIKYTITAESDTCVINVASQIQKGENLVFDVKLKPNVPDDYLLPTQSTSAIKIGDLYLNEGNYVYNVDVVADKAIYMVPSSFITANINLNIEAFKFDDVAITLVNSDTPIKLADETKPIAGFGYENFIKIKEGTTGRWALPDDITILMDDGEGTIPLRKYQYFYDKETGLFSIAEGVIVSPIVIHATAVDYDSILVRVGIYGNGGLSYNLPEGVDRIKYRQDGCTIELRPTEECFALTGNLSYMVFVNNKLVTDKCSYDFYNEHQATLFINTIIDGNILIVCSPKRLNAVRTFLPSDVKEKNKEVIVSINPDLYIGQNFVAYLVTKDPASFVLPDTLLAEVFDPDEHDFVTIDPSQYFYSKDTGIFMTINNNIVMGQIYLTLAAIPK